MAFQFQLPFVFLPEQTSNDEAAEIFPVLRLLCPAVLPPVEKEQESWTGKGSKSLMWCGLETSCDQQYSIEEAYLKCVHIRKGQPTEHYNGESSHTFSGTLARLDTSLKHLWETTE